MARRARARRRSSWSRRCRRCCSPACVALQLLAAGYALTLADGAAEAGALALASGGPAAAAARDALPAGPRTTSRSRSRRQGHGAPAAAVAVRGARRAARRHQLRRREAG